MSALRNVNAILRAIKDYKGLRTSKELAKFLGVCPSAISNWIARDYLDEELIRSKIPEVRIEFLQTGEFPMTDRDVFINSLLKRIETLEDAIQKLEEKYGEEKRI